MKASHGGDRGNQHTEEASGQFDHLAKTGDDLAKGYGIAEKTIRNDAQLSRSIDTLNTTIGNGTKETLLSRDSQLTAPRVSSSYPE